MTELYIPEYELTIHDGDCVRLHRFDSITWVVHFGWYTINGNRPICGWFLQEEQNQCVVKSLQYTDLSDIYMIER